MSSNDDTTGKIISFFDHKERHQRPAVSATPLHRLLGVMNDLSLKERFDFVVDNLFQEPADDENVARVNAQLNIDLFGCWMLDEVLFPPATEFPEVYARYPITVQLVDDARRRMIEIDRLRALTAPEQTDK